MSDIQRENGWQLVEEAGKATPDGMQRLLSTAVWDVDGVRDDLREYVLETLGHEQGVLVLDESGFLKKGTHSVGVKRQYSGTAGRVENCQIGVFLGYASEKGQALIDRVLYLPQEWVTDQVRRQEAKVPEEITFATKPALGRQMLERAFAAQIPAQWVTDDSIYGGDRRLRVWLEEQQRWFVLGIKKDEPLWNEFLLSRWGQSDNVLHALLVRRSLSGRELAYFVVFAPADTSLQTLVNALDD